MKGNIFPGSGNEDEGIFAVLYLPTTRLLAEKVDRPTMLSQM